MQSVSTQQPGAGGKIYAQSGSVCIIHSRAARVTFAHFGTSTPAACVPEKATSMLRYAWMDRSHARAAGAAPEDTADAAATSVMAATIIGATIIRCLMRPARTAT